MAQQLRTAPMTDASIQGSKCAGPIIVNLQCYAEEVRGITLTSEQSASDMFWSVTHSKQLFAWLAAANLDLADLCQNKTWMPNWHAQVSGLVNMLGK